MSSRRSAFVASGIILTIVAAIIVTCWLRYPPPAPIVAIIPKTTSAGTVGERTRRSGTDDRRNPVGHLLEWAIQRRPGRPADHPRAAHRVDSCGWLDPGARYCLALTTPVRHVLDKGIPTVIVSTGLPIDPRRNLGFVLNDDKAAGELAATYVARLLKDHGTVALLGDNSNVLSSTARAEVFAQTLKS
jgi:hypothetical protein